MKKFLSLMLTLALIITTLALPITASAADISLQALVEGKTITVSYTPSASTVHPGETFTIGVKATPSADITLDSYVVDINYDGTQFTLNNEETADLKKFDSNTTNAYVRLISETKDQSVTAADGLNLVTLNFTVKDTAVPSSYTTCILGDDTAFNVKNGHTIDWFVLGSNITDTKVTTTVAENTYTVKIDENELVPGKTYYKTSGVTVSVTGSGIESVKVNEESLTAGGDGAYTKVLTEGGEYTVKVKVIGKSEESKSFTLNTETIAAKLITDFAANELGYKKGDSFSVPVKITGLGTSAQAAMVSFKVEAAAGLTLDTTELGTGVTYDAENKTVMYGNTAGETGLGNDALVATLKFNVEDAAVYGVNSVTISDAKLALVKDIDPTADSIGNEINTQKVVVVPTAAFGTLPADITTKAWKNTAYTVEVTTADTAVSVKYLAVSDLTEVTTDTQEGLKAIYDNAQAVDNKTVTINSESKYVIVARVGDDTNAVYELVGTLTPGTNAWYDATNPTVDITEMDALTGVQDAKDGYSLNVSKLKKEDKLSGIAKVEYSLNGTDYIEFSGDTIALVAQNFNGNVTFKVTDKADNTAVSAGFALKLDMDDPTVKEMAVSAVKADASKDITANVADVGSGVTDGAITVAVYKGEAASEELSNISEIEALEKVADATLNEGVATYNTTTAGRYYFVAADAARHKAFASVDVAFETLDKASGIKVKVYANAANYVAGFKTTADTDLADFEETNGSFRYVAIKADAAATGYSNSLTLAKDGAEATAYTEETPITEAGNYVLTVTTTHGVNAADTESATYKFSIVNELDMPSPNGDKRFNIIDFAMVRQLVELGKALPIAENGFSGGIFSGDVTGDLTVNGYDYADIIRSVRAGEKPGAYTFNVFNK